jgi:hypothetical protein
VRAASAIGALSAVAAVVACGQRAGGEAARADSIPPAAADGRRQPQVATTAGGVEAIPVNRGTQGMRSTTRWVLSPDRRAILVVEDAVSVEGEALPDGFLYASEATDPVVQIDDVWDVAPSPDWTRLAFGRAFVLRAGERDTVPPDEWRRLEGWLPEDVGERDLHTLRRRLEAHTFPASGMSLMLGLGLTQVIWVDSLGLRRVPALPGPTHSLHGWRVRWTPTGDTLAAGAEPRMVQDDAPPSRWVLVRPRRWALYTDTLGGTTDSTHFARVGWVAGPTIELASPVDLSAQRDIAIDGGTVESRDGIIRVTTRGLGGGALTRVIGPGLALAATAGGRFIAALVPRTDAKEHGMRAYPVVYRVTPK